VQDERDGREDPLRAREERHQVALDPDRILVPRQAEAAGDPMDMRVHDDTRCEAVGAAEDHVGGLAPDAGQARELFHGPRHLAAVLVHERPARPEEGPGLGAEKAGGPDQALQPLRVGIGERRGIGIGAEEIGCDFVHTGVGALGRKNGCDEQLERRAVVELDVRVGTGSFQGAEKPAGAAPQVRSRVFP
jgi:hypothetical protein